MESVIEARIEGRVLDSARRGSVVGAGAAPPRGQPWWKTTVGGGKQLPKVAAGWRLGEVPKYDQQLPKRRLI